VGGMETNIILQTDRGRQYIGIEINAEYCRLADERIKSAGKGA